MIPVTERLIDAYLTERESANLLSELERDACWRRESFRLFGKQVLTPRLTAWCGDPGVSYRYTGIEHQAMGWYRCLDSLRASLEREAGERFNFVVLNRYANGDDYMGWHRDDERGLAAVIASVSLGQTRRFQVEDESGRREYSLGGGSLLIFDGSKRHRLPKQRRASGSRINLTFRRVSHAE